MKPTCRGAQDRGGERLVPNEVFEFLGLNVPEAKVCDFQLCDLVNSFISLSQFEMFYSFVCFVI